MPHQTTIWLLDSADIGDAALSAFEDWLGQSERARLGRFVRAERRRQFVAGRALLRQVLAPLLAVAPARVNLLERPGRAPLLDMAPPALPYFSLSHSGRWVACAVSPTTPVGLDIERRDSSRDLAALAAQAFDPARQAWLVAQPTDQRIDAFYRLWCEAEARIKLAQDAAGVYHLAHAELAISLCSAHALVRAPDLRFAGLDAMP